MNPKLGGQDISSQKVHNKEQLGVQFRQQFQTQQGSQGLGHGQQGL